jgi:hypothetical protein
LFLSTHYARNETKLQSSLTFFWRENATKSRPQRGLHGNFWDCREQRLGVGMLRELQDLGGWTHFDEFARPHHGHARGQLRHDRQAVRNLDQRQLEFLLQAHQQFQNLRAH